MNTFPPNLPVRQNVLNGLAAVGFIALVVLGVWLAAYSTRFVPGVVNTAGEAAVYIGSIFTSIPEPSISVSTSTSPTTSLAEDKKDSGVSTVSPKPAKPSAGAGTSNTYQIGGTLPAGPLTGLPDLSVEITSTGYLETTSADSFVASSTVPFGRRPAVKFTVKNIGTNRTGTWRFTAGVPAISTFFFQSQPQQSLLPGERIDYTLGFDRAVAGVGKIISIIVNFDRVVTESNSENNTDSAAVTILGS